MNIMHSPIGHPMFGFATVTINTANKTVEEVGAEVEKSIDSASDAAKTRGVRLSNVQVVPLNSLQEAGLLLIFTIERN
jgi:hypothetical protein